MSPATPITLIVPSDNQVALQAAAEMFRVMAAGTPALAPAALPLTSSGAPLQSAQSEPSIEEAPQNYPAATGEAPPPPAATGKASPPPETATGKAPPPPSETPETAPQSAAGEAPPPPETAESAPAAAEGAPAAATIVDLDSEGLPWDVRIHTPKRTKRQGDSTWKLKRGVDQELVVEVKAELKRTVDANNAARGAAPPAGAATAVGPADTPAGAATAAPPPPATEGVAAGFPALMVRVTQAKIAGDLTDEQVEAAVKHPTVGLDNFSLLPNAPDLVPIVEKLLFGEGQ